MNEGQGAEIRVRLAPLLLSAALLGSTASAQAQEAAEAVLTLEPIKLEGVAAERKGSDPVSGVAAQASATGARTDAWIVEIPQSLSVVGRTEMERRGAASVTEALRYAPGVTTTGRPATRYDIGGIRGFGAQGGQGWFDYLDGMRMLRGGYNAPVMDPWNLERVEVLRGPASSLYGGGTPGGMVNQVTKRPRAEAARQVELRFSHPQGMGLAADLTGPLAGDERLLYRLVGLASGVDGEVDQTRTERFMLAPSFTWRPAETTELTVQAGAMRDPESFYAVYLPSVGVLIDHPSGQNIPYDFNLEDPDFDRFDREEFWAGYELSHGFSPQVKLVHSLRFMDVGSDQRGMIPPPQAFQAWERPDGTILRRVGSHVADDSRMLTLDARLEADLTTGPATHRLIAGIDHQRLDFARQSSNDLLAPSIDYLHPAYGIAFDPPFARRIEEERRQTGFYLQDQIRLGGLTFTGGLRRDSYASDMATTDLASGLSRIGEVEHSKTTARLGATYDLGHGFFPYAGWSTSFEPQASSVTGLDASGALTAFKPTTGEQWEVGLRYEPQGFPGLITASLFQITQENLAVSTGTPNAGCSNPLNCQIQAGEVRSRGLELEAKAEVLPGFDLIASYSYTDLEITKSGAPGSAPVGASPAGVPKHQAALWGHYEFGEGSPAAGLGLGLGLRHVGASWGDAANQHRVPAFTLVDAAASYDLGRIAPELEGARLRLGASNLLDKNYVASCAAVGTSTSLGPTGYCFYGEGRRGTLTLSYEW